MVVNMWREQVGQPPLTEDEITAALTPVEAAGAPGQLKLGGGGKTSDDRLSSTAKKPVGFQTGGRRSRRGGGKTSVSRGFSSPSINNAAAADADDNATTRFKWTVPDQWRAVPPGQMVVAKFNVPAQEGAKADVTVSIFPATPGGSAAQREPLAQTIGLADIGRATSRR
jgi:hypothetical protein